MRPCAPRRIALVAKVAPQIAPWQTRTGYQSSSSDCLAILHHKWNRQVEVEASFPSLFKAAANIQNRLSHIELFQSPSPKTGIILNLQHESKSSPPDHGWLGYRP
jgi:hypothetical protein